jgi:hypothetical protein
MKWEYLVIEESMSYKELTKLGAAGWELVAVVSPGHFILHYFLKRAAGS